MNKPLGVILAGGLAKRMGGGDKGRLPLGDTSLIGQVIHRLAPQVGQMALNANGDPTRYKDLALPVLADSIQDYPGPLAGVLAGLDWAETLGASHIVSVAADTPFFPTDMVAHLQTAAQDSPKALALACSKDADGKIWRQPTFGYWPVALRDDLRAALQDGLRKVVLWTDRHHAAQAVFEEDSFDPFFNVNTPEDHRKAQTIWEAQR